MPLPQYVLHPTKFSLTAPGSNSTPDFENKNYVEWRRVRIALLTELLGGPEWFKGKTVLELACAYGHVGRELQKLGAIVTFAEGRAEYVESMLNDGLEAYVLDQDRPWDFERKFDLIIHWGVLYHLTNWKQDLACALNNTNLMCLESEASGRFNPNESDPRPEKGYDQALNGMGSIISTHSIEKTLTKLGATFTRYDDPKINVACHRYDWPDNEFFKMGMRRFWLVRK